MLLASFDIAPAGGAYKVYGADGKIIGNMIMAEGDILPPVISDLDYFEKTEN